jgi:pilus assembly protein CpaE
MDLKSSRFAPSGLRSMAGDKALVLLSTEEVCRAAFPGPEIAGFTIGMAAGDVRAPLDRDGLGDAAVVVLEVDPESAPSVRRLGMAAQLPKRPFVVAAMREPSLAQIRMLLREGAKDVIALPLLADDLTALLVQIRKDLEAARGGKQGGGKIISIVKSVGGVGATAIAAQAACLFAEQEAKAGRSACFIDLDIQFGNAAVYLGENPKLTLHDIIEAGERVDGALVNSVVSLHSSGLSIIAAPNEMMPLEAVDTDQICEFVDIASREFSTLFLDLPGNWTNWSLSLAARSDIILLVTELTVPSLRQARRQLNLLIEQGSSDLDVRIVLNRYEKGVFKALKIEDAAHALGRPVDFTVANDFPVVSAALDQGVRFSEIKARNRVTRDLALLVSGLSERLHGGR